MENYKVRMLFELLDLTVRIEKLKGKTYGATSLTEQKVVLMEKQLKTMIDYKDILTERLVIELGDEEYGRNDNK